MLRRSPVHFVRQAGIANDGFAVKPDLANTGKGIDPAAMIAESVDVFIGQQGGLDHDDLGRHQVVAPRRMHMEKVDQRHRRRDGELNVKTDFDVHGVSCQKMSERLPSDVEPSSFAWLRVCKPGQHQPGAAGAVKM